MTKKSVSISVMSAVMIAWAGGATAHVSIDNRNVKHGSFKARFNVPHGCDGAATKTVIVTVPEGIIGVKPMPKAGWHLETTKGKFARAYDFHHGMKVSEGVTSVTWNGGHLPNEFFDEFVMSIFVTDAFKGGDKIYFPVTQICKSGRLDWVEKPKDGQDPHSLESPAPFITVMAADKDDASAHHHHGGGDKAASAPKAASITVGALGITAARVRETPGGATLTAGYLTIANTGTGEDRLVSAHFDVAERTEIHETTMDDGMMRMRHRPDGLVIPAGGTLEMKSGGAHIMLLDVKAPIKAGGTITGKLKFEKAGEADVSFTVEPLASSGSTGGASGSHDHSHH